MQNYVCFKITHMGQCLAVWMRLGRERIDRTFIPLGLGLTETRVISVTRDKGERRKEGSFPALGGRGFALRGLQRGDVLICHCFCLCPLTSLESCWEAFPIPPVGHSGEGTEDRLESPGEGHRAVWTRGPFFGSKFQAAASPCYHMAPLVPEEAELCLPSLVEKCGACASLCLRS